MWCLVHEPMHSEIKEYMHKNYYIYIYNNFYDFSNLSHTFLSVLSPTTFTIFFSVAVCGYLWNLSYYLFPFSSRRWSVEFCSLRFSFLFYCSIQFTIFSKFGIQDLLVNFLLEVEAQSARWIINVVVGPGYTTIIMECGRLR